VRFGVLRVGLFPSFFYRKDRASGELRGVGIEIARSLSDRIGVAITCEEYPSPPRVVEALSAGAVDVALLGIDPSRAAAVDFTSPLIAADFSYLVPEGSAIHTVADVDKPGTRIALVRHHAMDTSLRDNLAHAVRVYADTPDDAFELFRRREADVLAGIRPGLLNCARRQPGTRVLPDRYGRNVIALAVKKDEAAWFSYATEFVWQAKADGTIDQAIAHAGLGGVEVANP
jgi:polar amino acid transport system substrate-binding protein